MRNWIKRFLKIFLAVGLSFIISGFIFADEESHTVEAYTLNKQIVIDPLTYSFEYENDYRDEMYFTIDATPEGVSKYFGRNNAATFKVGNDLVVKLYYIASPFSGGELNMFVEITGNIDEKWQFEFQESSLNYSGTFATIKNRFYHLTFFPNFDEPETSTEKGKVFVEKAQKLPYVSQLKNMTQTQFNRAANEIAATRAYYNKLSHSERDLTYPWDYYLEQKEDIVGQSFIYEVKQLPNSGDITSLLSNEVIGLQYRMDDLQNKYNRLSTNAKNNPEVSKWYGYFKIKKDILYNNSDVSLTPLHFVHEAKKLPIVSEINRMSLSQLDALDAEIARVFDLYERMNGFNEQSNTWLKYLIDKANAVFKRKFSLRYESEAIHSFLDHAKALPNNSEIEEMAIIQLEQTKQATSEVRNLYNKLTGEEKADTRVVNWVGFLNAKETAVNNGLASEKELFSDLSSSHWAYNRVMSLHEMGIING